MSASSSPQGEHPFPTIPYSRERLVSDAMRASARRFLHAARLRRSIRAFYVAESVGIACGYLLAALNEAGLATLTHTPSPMNFLREILQRPLTERPYLLIPVGYPAEGCRVPDIRKKPLSEVLIEL